MKNTIKFFLFFNFLLITFNYQVEAAQLHAIIVCDTHADNIEASVRADYNRIVKEVKNICKLTKLTPKLKTFTGYKVDTDFVDFIDDLKVNSDDVIIFYYSGHGKRFEDQEDQWPVFDLTYDYTPVFQLALTQLLMEKHPRLLLSISDCCNEILEKSLIRSTSDKKIKKIHYRTLFLESAGTYIAAAALPDEVSLGLNKKVKDWDLPAGGYYTTALLEVLDTETSKPDATVSWDLIFTLTGEKTIEYQLRDEDDPFVYHHPQFLYIPN